MSCDFAVFHCPSDGLTGSLGGKCAIIIYCHYQGPKRTFNSIVADIAQRTFVIIIRTGGK